MLTGHWFAVGMGTAKYYAFYQDSIKPFARIPIFTVFHSTLKVTCISKELEWVYPYGALHSQNDMSLENYAIYINRSLENLYRK